MNPFVEALAVPLGIGIRELETYFTNRADIRKKLGGVRETLNLPQPDSDMAQLARDDAELALQIATSLRAAADTLDPEIARHVKSVLACAEQAIAADIRALAAHGISGIYVIVDPEATRGRPVAQVARQSLEGGAKVIQLRDKLNDKGAILESARELRAICDEYDALFVMNDHADIARASDAHVLHVGQTDLPIADARDILAPTQLIGNSNNGLREALPSSEQAVDYLAVGAIYATATMGKSARRALGPEEITRVKAAVSQPIVAIGGINKSNITDVAKAGADSVCVVSAITFADDPEAATRELVRLYQDASN